MATPSTMDLPLGAIAPDFAIPNIDGKTVSLEDFADPALLVMFICNHCPYVKHLQAHLAQLVKEYQKKGVAVVGINSNDVERYPDDSPDKMAETAKKYGFTFPYLFDEAQEIAKAYKAACTPDFFLFDKERKLI
ncbi:MAG: thioredoxin family protein, partial [Anaerolineales bacterium]